MKNKNESGNKKKKDKSVPPSGGKGVLNTIPEAIADIKKGKLIIVVDDEDRENEGDFIAAAHGVTPQIINFMATHGRGLICMPMSGHKVDNLWSYAMRSGNKIAFVFAVFIIYHNY